MALAASILGTLGGLIPGARIAKAAKAKQATAETAMVQTVKGIDKAMKAGAIQAEKFAVAMDSKQSHATKDMVDLIQGKAA